MIAYRTCCHTLIDFVFLAKVWSGLHVQHTNYVWIVENIGTGQYHLLYITNGNICPIREKYS